MRYSLLLHNAEPAEGEVPEEAIAAMQEAFAAYGRALESAGVLVAAEVLASATVSTTVTRHDGGPQIQDGPFAQTKEALAGIFLIGASPMLGGDATPQENPIPATAESLHLGEHVYAHHCLTCHGIGGAGDGPEGRGLQPPPSDLSEHVPHAPDWQLFEIIRDGVRGTAMIGCGDRLEDEDTWHLINYVRTLDGSVAPHDHDHTH
jgi:hypothetical protein